MKYTLTLLFVIAFSPATHSQVWLPVGGAMTDSATDKTAIAIDKLNNPFVIYQDQSDGNRAKVKSYLGSTGWYAVGSSVSTSGAAFLCVAIDTANDFTYVAYQDSASGNKASVLRYNGTAWAPAGSLPQVSPAPAEHLSLAIDKQGTPYLGYTDFSTGAKAMVKKFDGSAWVYLGATTPSPGTQTNTRIALDTADSLYVAYTDIPNASKITVRKFTGSSWTDVGVPGFSADTAEEIALTISRPGTPYVAYADASAGRKAVVKKFDGTSWVTVGSGPLSDSTATDISIVVDSAGTPYVAYRDYGATTYPSGCSVKKFNGTGWVYVGGPAFASFLARSPQIVASPAGDLFVAQSRDASPGGDGHVYRLTYAVSPGFKNIESSNTLTVWPNPASHKFELRLESLVVEPIEITVISAAGRTVHSRETQSNIDVTLNLREPPGIYLVRVVSSSGTYISRINIE